MQPIHRKQAANVLFVQTNVEITYKPEPETHITQTASLSKYIIKTRNCDLVYVHSISHHLFYE